MLWRNLRIGALEIDLVVKKDDLVAIVEVRARGEGSFEKPLESISAEKRRLLLRASRALWRGRIAKMPDVLRVRIDVVAQHADGSLEHVPAAITENDA